jgi:tetratricopeptide (TPR) repeat protein
MIRICNENKNYEEGIKALNRYLALKPKHEHMQYALAGLLYKVEDYQGSKKILEEILEHNPMQVDAQMLMRDVQKTLKRIYESKVS